MSEFQSVGDQSGFTAAEQPALPIDIQDQRLRELVTPQFFTEQLPSFQVEDWQDQVRVFVGKRMDIIRAIVQKHSLKGGKLEPAERALLLTCLSQMNLLTVGWPKDRQWIFSQPPRKTLETINNFAVKVLGGQASDESSIKESAVEVENETESPTTGEETALHTYQRGYAQIAGIAAETDPGVMHEYILGELEAQRDISVNYAEGLRAIAQSMGIEISQAALPEELVATVVEAIRLHADRRRADIEYTRLLEDQNQNLLAAQEKIMAQTELRGLFARQAVAENAEVVKFGPVGSALVNLMEPWADPKFWQPPLVVEESFISTGLVNRGGREPRAHNVKQYLTGYMNRVHPDVLSGIRENDMSLVELVDELVIGGTAKVINEIEPKIIEFLSLFPQDSGAINEQRLGDFTLDLLMTTNLRETERFDLGGTLETLDLENLERNNGLKEFCAKHKSELERLARRLTNLGINFNLEVAHDGTELVLSRQLAELIRLVYKISSSSAIVNGWNIPIDTLSILSRLAEGKSGGPIIPKDEFGKYPPTQVEIIRVDDRQIFPAGWVASEETLGFVGEEMGRAAREFENTYPLLKENIGRKIFVLQGLETYVTRGRISFVGETDDVIQHYMDRLSTGLPADRKVSVQRTADDTVESTVIFSPESCFKELRGVLGESFEGVIKLLMLDNGDIDQVVNTLQSRGTSEGTIEWLKSMADPDGKIIYFQAGGYLSRRSDGLDVTVNTPTIIAATKSYDWETNPDSRNRLRDQVRHVLAHEMGEAIYVRLTEPGYRTMVKIVDDFSEAIARKEIAPLRFSAAKDGRNEVFSEMVAMVLTGRGEKVLGSYTASQIRSILENAPGGGPKNEFRQVLDGVMEKLKSRKL